MAKIETAKRYRLQKHDTLTDKKIRSSETFTAEEIEALGYQKIDENGEVVE